MRIRTTRVLHRELMKTLLQLAVLTLILHFLKLGGESFIVAIAAVIIVMHIVRMAAAFSLVRPSLQELRGLFKQVTLGIDKGEALARFVFANDAVIWIRGIPDQDHANAVEALARYSEAEFGVLVVVPKFPIRFKASVDRGRHFLRGVAMVTCREDSDLVDLVQRYPKGNEHFARELFGAVQATIQWGLRGVSPPDLKDAYSGKDFPLEHLPFSVRILVGKLVSNSSGR